MRKKKSSNNLTKVWRKKNERDTNNKNTKRNYIKKLTILRSLLLKKQNIKHRSKNVMSYI